MPVIQRWRSKQNKNKTTALLHPLPPFKADLTWAWEAGPSGMQHWGLEYSLPSSRLNRHPCLSRLTGMYLSETTSCISHLPEQLVGGCSPPPPPPARTYSLACFQLTAKSQGLHLCRISYPPSPFHSYHNHPPLAPRPWRQRAEVSLFTLCPHLNPSFT